MIGLGTGLLDRHGYLYECGDYCHCETAETIVDERHYTHPTYEWPLDILIHGKGWIHIGYAAGIFTGSRHHPSQAQLDALWDIAQATTNGYLKSELLSYLERWQETA